jgi:hypothetical protein
MPQGLYDVKGCRRNFYKITKMNFCNEADVSRDQRKDLRRHLSDEVLERPGQRLPSLLHPITGWDFPRRFVKRYNTKG